MAWCQSYFMWTLLITIHNCYYFPISDTFFIIHRLSVCKLCFLLDALIFRVCFDTIFVVLFFFVIIRKRWLNQQSQCNCEKLHVLHAKPNNWHLKRIFKRAREKKEMQLNNFCIRQTTNFIWVERVHKCLFWVQLFLCEMQLSCELQDIEMLLTKWHKDTNKNSNYEKNDQKLNFRLCNATKHH